MGKICSSTDARWQINNFIVEAIFNQAASIDAVFFE
jgi:hypothetical protein